MSSAEIAEPIEMPLGMWTQAGQRNHVLHGGPDPAKQSGNFEGRKGQPIVK